MFADDIVLVILGPKWADAAAIFRLLTPTILVFGIINPLGWLLQSIGLQGRSLRIALVIAPLVIAAYLLGLPYGPNGVAFAYSAAMTLWLVPHVLWCLHGTIISPWELLLAASRPFLSCIVAAAFAFVVQFYLGQLQSPVCRLLLGGGVMLVGYLCMLLFVMGSEDVLFRASQGTENLPFREVDEGVGSRIHGGSSVMSQLKEGNWVEVRSKEEILSSLDKDGRLEGLPFMPQMFQYCGRRFKVFKRAHKTCDTVSGNTVGRKLSKGVHLDLRCDGQVYGGCQAACLIFWKEAWLKPANQQKELGRILIAR